MNRWRWLILTLLAGTATARNLALEGAARSWLPSSQTADSAAPALAADGDLLTFWASTLPDENPPKDLGIEWPAPRTIGSVVIRFFSDGYLPSPTGWRLEARTDGVWSPLAATLGHGDSSWWTLTFPPLRAEAVRLVVEAYRGQRPAIAEFEVYEGPPPVPEHRIPPFASGAFWQFHHARWARHYRTDAALAAEVENAHRIGLDDIILYTVDGGEGRYRTVVPECSLTMLPEWENRDPVEAILNEADRLGMRVFLGDAPPHGFMGQANQHQIREAQRSLYHYRRAMLTRYRAHPSLAGYYLNFECLPDRFDNDPTFPAQKSAELATFVKRVDPKLLVIQPIGLYRWRDDHKAPWRPVTPVELERFWRPYINTSAAVDVFLVIDGVGTGLAPLNLTHVNQGYLRELCDELGRTMWVDVECAEFSDYSSMPWNRLEVSLDVAARHADRIVLFDYLNYLAPGNGRAGSAELYEAYRAARE